MDNKKQRILMIANNDIISSESLGVSKKLRGEYKAFQRVGADVYFLTFHHNDIVLLHESETIVIYHCRNEFGYIQNLFFFNVAPTICEELNIDFCYIRFPLSDWAFMKMVRTLHRICKVYIEIPTYPYDEENRKYKNPVSRFNYAQDLFFRRQWKKYVDQVVTFSDDKEIYGVPCININNGIDLDTVKYVGDELSYEGDITLISVALMRPIHGYDRVIEGMARYYRKNIKPERIVRYLVVGNGPELVHLQQMVRDYKLESYVEFCGKQSGTELDALFRKSNLGLAVLAGHREGHESVSDLKSREYCARGLPFITANNDRAIPAGASFMKKIPMNEEPLDIDEVIQYFDYIRAHKEIHQECRVYAEQNFSWQKQMGKVFTT